MKKLLALALVSSFSFLAQAGQDLSSKEIVQQAPAAVEWYRAHEWDLDLWGTYAFPGNTGDHDTVLFAGELVGVDGGPFFESTRSSNDRFIDRDNAWGGGADVKYFFTRYWALGVEGMVLDCNVNEGGAGFGTFTFRYPIGHSRFAPYAWAGGGVTAGGGRHAETHGFTVLTGVRTFPFSFENDIENKHADATVQMGTGMEVRLTRCIGLMGDFAWNIVSGPDNNFGMTRFGLTLSY
jgi:hypothetical protein